MTVGWRLITGDGGPSDVPVADGATNMATDQALLDAVRAGATPVVRFYRWDPAALSFGRNQPAAGRYDEEAARARGIAFVRRPTGGQAVLHADELTYAVVAPVTVIGRPREAYRRINEALVGGLRRLGIAAELAGAETALSPAVGSAAGAAAEGARPGHSPAGSPDWSAACFRAPAPGEVVVNGRKLVGSAQRCEGRTILQHGSILMGGSQSAAEELLTSQPGGDGRGDVGGNDVGKGASDAPESTERPRHTGMEGWATMEDVMGHRAGWDEVVRAQLSGWSDVIGTPLAPAALSTDESMRVRELVPRFASREWTWRR